MSEIENCCGTTCDKVKLASEISELKAKIAEQDDRIEELTNCFNDRKALCRQAFAANEAQAETINQLAARIDILRNLANQLSFELAHDESYKTTSTFCDLQDALAATPAQCLAEVKAQAVEIEACEWLHNNYPKLSDPVCGLLAFRANQIRQQANKCDT